MLASPNSLPEHIRAQVDEILNQHPAAAMEAMPDSILG